MNKAQQQIAILMMVIDEEIDDLRPDTLINLVSILNVKFASLTNEERNTIYPDDEYITWKVKHFKLVNSNHK